jgi:hypothetical protein
VKCQQSGSRDARWCPRKKKKKLILGCPSKQQQQQPVNLSLRPELARHEKHLELATNQKSLWD